MNPPRFSLLCPRAILPVLTTAFCTVIGVACLFAPASADAQATQTYNGNGLLGFNGQIGNSRLTVSNGGSTINFSLTTTGFNGNVLALYIDSVAGGFNSTSTFTDNGNNTDTGRQGLSGFSTNGRTVATFAPGFNADYGIALQPGAFAGLFNLTQVNGSFPFVASAGLDTAATTTLNFSVNRSDIGLPATGGGFQFEATLLSGTAYRSDETIGTSVTLVDPTNPGTAPNAGFTGTTTFTASNVFGTPEPSTWALLGIGTGLLGLTLRRRATRI